MEFIMDFELVVYVILGEVGSQISMWPFHGGHGIFHMITYEEKQILIWIAYVFDDWL